jgi:type I restriction enzyme, S subunit
VTSLGRQSWPRVRCRFLFHEVNERGFALPLASVTRDGGVELRSDLNIEVWNPGDDVSNYKRVLPGDFVIGLRSFQSGIGYSGLAGLVSPAYTVLRPVVGRVRHAYFRHLFKSDWFISRLENVAQGIRQGRTIGTNDFYDIHVNVPPEAIQDSIADFLDAETARIDALITKKRRLIERLDERFWAYVTSQVQEECAPFVPLRRFIGSITDGPFGSSLTSSHYSDSGVRIVRLGNIGRGTFRDKDQAFIPLIRLADLARHCVNAGDLLIAGLGDTSNHVGRACVAPDLGPAIVKADCYCAQVLPDRALADYLALFLSSPTGADSVALAARGTTRSRINLDIAKEVLVPLIPLKAQRRIIDEVTELRVTQTNTSNKLNRQIALLQERRQALITAAVTGQIEIPGAAA